jgi:hypothetical protein
LESSSRGAMGARNAGVESVSKLLRLLAGVPYCAAAIFVAQKLSRQSLT